jgi:UDP-N-acetylmuramate dehydrogenase
MTIQNSKKLKIQNDIKKLLPKVKENVSLKDYTTFRIGGKARYFFETKTKKDIIQAIKTAKKIGLPFFILGGGSNVLISDEGIEGLVIKIQNSKLKVKNCNSKSKIICAEAGTSLSLLVSKAKQNNLSGLEWAAGIPGTVGGAVWINASAFGRAFGDFVKRVEVLDTENLKIKKIPKKECKFSYKKSIFQKRKNYIILEAELILKKGNKKDIERKIQEYLKRKKESQPLNFPSAGCVFKNVKIQNSKFKIKEKSLFKKFPELKNFIENGQIPAGYLIEKAGLSGKKIGKAMISKKHANFILNLGKAKAEDVKKLIRLVKRKVKKVFQIDLMEEIVIYPH